MRICDFNSNLKQIKWKSYTGSNNSSYLDWYFCDNNVRDFPIRDVSERKKLEPHYEDGSFNAHSRCNRLLLSGSVSRNESHIFFFTKYIGKIKKYRGKFFITGYYKISKISRVPDKDGSRIAVLTDKPIFLRIQDALPLYKIVKDIPKNPRHVIKRLEKKQTDIILEHFKNKKNMIKEYTRETEVLTMKINTIQISPVKI